MKRQTKWTIGGGALAVVIVAGLAGSTGEQTATTSTESTVTTAAPETTTTDAPATTAAPETSSSVEVEAPDNIPAELNDDDDFVDHLREWSADKPLNIVDYASDDEMIGLATAWCDYLNTDPTVEGITDLFTIGIIGLQTNENLADVGYEPDFEGIDAEAYANLWFAAVSTYCPEHMPLLDEMSGG